jgi:hypothetical protein
MGTRDPRIDAYIEKSAEFARPILTRMRELVHESCPDVIETLKWRNPSFEYGGLLGGMAAFKQHCAFGFWKHELVVGDDAKAADALGSLGRLTKLSDLPTKARFAGYVKKAMRLNEEGVKVVRPKTPVKMHPQLAAALAKSAKARKTYQAFPPGQKREYLDWVAEAKSDDTRERRVAQAVEWMAAGKRRNWKYERR